MPERALGATARRSRRSALAGRCSIEVVRCQCFTELQGRYLDDPEAGPCDCFKVGDRIDITPANIDEMCRSKRMCPHAWRVLEPYVMAALSVGATKECAPASESTQAVVSCPDGTRPVIFKLTAKP